jgi:DNA-directed RNA polymerase subunit N (RpoN/RPB10)
LQSFLTKIDPRRQTFLNLAGQIEGQLRAVYDQRYRAGEATQSSLAEKLGVNRSCIHHRLMGHTNMTTETIADMVWALGCAIKIEIYDPQTVLGLNHFICSTPGPIPQAVPSTPPQPIQASTAPLPDSISRFVTPKSASIPPSLVFEP